MQVGPPPPWLEERKPEQWKPRDVANAVLIDRSAVLHLYTKSPLALVLYQHLQGHGLPGMKLHLLTSSWSLLCARACRHLRELGLTQHGAVPAWHSMQLAQLQRVAALNCNAAWHSYLNLGCTEIVRDCLC